MRFFFAGSEPKTMPETTTVTIVSTPARRVVSIGGSGAYSETNVGELRSKLEAWFLSNREWRPTGKPYAVYWNGPFTPWFLKRFEVHVPIAPTP